MRQMTLQNNILLIITGSIYERRRVIATMLRPRKAVAFTLVLILTLSITLCSLSTKASADSSMTTYKYYTSIQISAGDSLWSIAKTNYNPNIETITEYMNEVKKINGLTDDSLIHGHYLIIPYHSSFFIK